LNNSKLAAEDLRYLWHPCTQMKDHEWLPLVPIRRGQGVWLEDFDGRRYLDAISSWWVNLFGHAHPYINERIRDQLDELEHVILAGFTHKPAVELARRLVEITPPGLDKVFFADNGSSAVEVALKMSFHYWRNAGQPEKRDFVTLSNSYHGETLGALAVGDVQLYKETYEPLLLQAITAPSPDCYGREAGASCEAHSREAFAATRAVLERHADSVCAIIVEPLVQCAGGMRMYDPVYLSLLRESCNELGIHLIADEIAVGFGRTGSLFACEQAAISPDFMCLSKGLTGGYLPLSAVLTSNHVYEAFYDDYTNLTAFLHSHSYTGNPLGCAAALATLDLLADGTVLERNRATAAYMGAAVADLQEHRHVGEIRQRGMILAIEMVAERAGLTAFPWQERRGLSVYQYGLNHGVLLRPLGNVVYFMPPYIIEDEHIDLMARTARDGIHAATCD